MKTTINSVCPLISVCMPVFNGEKYIPESIESVLAQTEKMFELLVVDNCSTDRTLEIVSVYSDPRIKTHKNDRNLGLFGNVNECVKIAKGKYIVILPHDDLILPSMLETFSQTLESDRKIGLVYSSYYQIDSESKRIKAVITEPASRVMSGDEAFRKFIRTCPIQCAMIRRDIFRRIGTFDPDLPLSGDVNMWCRIALNGYKIAYHKAPQNCTRVHPSSMTRYISTKGEYGLQLFKCFQKVFEDIPSQSTLHGLRSRAARWPLKSQLVYIIRTLKTHNWKMVKYHFDLLFEITRWAGGFMVVVFLFAEIVDLVVRRLPGWVVRKLNGCEGE